jgi:Domain of unknown function (DUF1836).
MCTPDEIMKYHCPRWDELPQIDLYMDQLLSVLENYLSIFAYEDSKIITSTMVNNYVKHKIIRPPVNKKYNKHHISFLYIICILKRLMGLSEIYNTKMKMKEQFPVDKAYDLFCDIFEDSIKTRFDLSYQSNLGKSDIKEIIIIESVTTSFANILYARYLVSTIGEPIYINKKLK